MATVNFYLTKKDKKNLFSIMLVYQDCGSKFRYFTKHKVPKNHLVKNRVKEKILNDYEINDDLKKYETVM